MALSRDLPAEQVSVHERIELPEIKPFVERVVGQFGLLPSAIVMPGLDPGIHAVRLAPAARA